MWSKGSLIALAVSMLMASAGEAQQPPRPRRDGSDAAIARLEREVAQLKRELQQLRMQSRQGFAGNLQGRRGEMGLGMRGGQGMAFRSMPGRPGFGQGFGQGFGPGFNRPGQPFQGRPAFGPPRGFQRDGFQQGGKKAGGKKHGVKKPGKHKKQVKGAKGKAKSKPGERPELRRGPPPPRPRVRI